MMRAAGGAFADSEFSFICIPQAGGTLRLRVPTQYDLTGKAPPAEQAEQLQIRLLAHENLVATIVGTFAALRAAGRPLVLDVDLAMTKTDKALVATAVTMH